MDFFNEKGPKQKQFYAALISGIVVISGILIFALNFNRDPKRIITGEDVRSSKNSVESGEISSSELQGIEVIVASSSQASSSRRVSSSDPDAVHSIFSYSEPEPIGPTSLPEESRVKSDKTVRVIVKAPATEKKPQEPVAPSEQIHSASGTPKPEDTPSEKTPESGGTSEPGASVSEASESATSEPQPPKEPLYVAGILAQDAYERQENGKNPVHVYRHPTLDMVLDLRDDLKLAKRLYVLPIEDGFYLFDRSMIALLGLSRNDKQAWVDENNTPGAIYMRPLSKATKELAEKEDRSAIFKSFGDRYIMIEQLSWLNEDQKALLTALGEKPVDVYAIEPHILLGQKVADDTPATHADAASEWAGIVSGLTDNPAAVEWAHGLPLYADHPNYHGKTADLRKAWPIETPIYRFGQIDLDGDEQPEYVIHAAAKGDKVNRIQGYWAVFQPSSTGLQMIASSGYANGPMIRTQNGLTYLSSFEADDGMTLYRTDAPLPMKVRDEAVHSIAFHRPQGLMSTLTGKALAEAYPKCAVLAARDGSGYYLVDTAELIGWRDEFATAAADGALYSADGLKDGVYAEPLAVEDPVEYLRSAYPMLPISDEDLETAVPLSKFKTLEAPLTADRLK